jgi:TrmH family RNA methyltransferase
MISKNEAKYIQSLFHKKTRQEEGVFVVEGPKIVEELINSDYIIKKVFATDEWKRPAKFAGEVISMTDDELQRITGLQTGNQLLAIAEQKKHDDIPSLTGELSLALDNIQDPGNLGTIIRIADWFGIKQIIASRNTAELYNPKVIQSTMGSFVRVKVCYADLNEILQKQKIPVYGALLNGKDVAEAGKITEGILVIGNESKGISEDIKKLITEPLTISKIGGAESLNAAIATGIILSHIVR